MDAEERGVILGELKAFRAEANTRLINLEKEVKRLSNFKTRITAYATVVVVALKAFEHYLFGK